MAAAGAQVTVPYRETNPATSSTSTFTAETVVDSITVSLVAGKVYELIYDALFNSTVAGDVANIQVRHTNISGTVLASGGDIMLAVGSSRVWPGHIHLHEYTAPSSGSTTFVVTAQRRSGGSGNLIRYAAATAPAQLSVREVL